MTAPAAITCTATNAAARQWLDELNGPGSGSLRQPAHLATLSLGDPVTCTLGASSFTWYVEQLVTDVIGEPGTLWVTASGRGPISRLENGIVWPRGMDPDDGIPVAQSSVSDRSFHWSAPEGLTLDLGVTWDNPVAVAWADDDTARAGYPETWPDLDPDGLASWIWPSPGPTTDVPAGATAYFRLAASVTTAGSYKLWVAADNAADIYVDGRQVVSIGIDTEGGMEWMTAQTADFDMDAGDHVIAAKVSNSTRHASGSNPAGLLLLCRRADPEETDPTLWLPSFASDASWDCTTDEPSFAVEDIVDLLMTESAAMGDGPLPAVTVDSELRVSRTWQIGTTLLDVMMDLVEMGATLKASGTAVALVDTPTGTAATLSGTTNCMSLSITRQAARATKALVRSPDGWLLTGSGAATYVEAGQSGTPTDAQAVADAALEQMAARTLVSAGDCVPVAPIPTPGGTVTFPGGSGRCISVSVTEDDAGLATYTPEVEA